MMKSKRVIFQIILLAALCALCAAGAVAQNTQEVSEEEEFGPMVRAYLGYLRGEQEVVDDRVSRREISPAYYRRNSNRIRALRQTAIRIARESGNDYLPELEATTRDEMKNLFERPPSAAELRIGEVINNTFRYLGTVRAGEVFYIFSRLDPYEQSELMNKEKRQQAADGKTLPVGQPSQPEQQSQPAAPTAATGAGDDTRPRRASSP
jgi:hypothetical protein